MLTSLWQPGNKNNIKKWKSVNRELLPVNDTLEETEKPELLVKKVFNASNVFVVKNIEEEEEEEENYLVVNVVGRRHFCF